MTTLAPTKPRPLMILSALAAHDVIGQLNARQLQVMGTLAASPDPLPVGRIADAIDTLSSSVSRASDKLFDLGLIERRQTDEDRRLILLALTGAGKRAYAALERIFDAGGAR